MNSKKSKEETIKVVARCRPMNTGEKKRNADSVVVLNKETNSVSITANQLPKPRKFLFDTVYDEEATQSEVYETSVRPMVEQMMQGFNVTILAYGQTGTGKTFSMEGNSNERGLMQKAFTQIFEFTKNQTNCVSHVQCSYLEIYQGKIRDLLNGSKPIDISNSGLTLPCRGLQVVTCMTEDEIEKCRQLGFKSRKVASTCFNEHSSRSHSIFTVTLLMKDKTSKKVVVKSKLNLVDLAGSESLQKSKTTDPVRMKECMEINLSLLAVKKVISSSVTGKPYIPYRDSLLTRLLQDSFGGNSRTLMIANIGPAEITYKETLTTLDYATQAKKIKIVAPVIKRKESLNTRNKKAQLAEIESIKLECEALAKREQELMPLVTALYQSYVDVTEKIKQRRGNLADSQSTEEFEMLAQQIALLAELTPESTPNP